MSRLFDWIHDSQKPVYTIHIAAELLGCHPRTLRIYEESGLIHPRRTEKRYRLYSQHDLTTVKKICSLMDEWSLNLSGVRALFEMAQRFHIEVEKMFDEMLP
jgi:MerR family transcriptional regulator/heat shock protein HspR